jgi:hypothetical protein
LLEAIAGRLVRLRQDQPGAANAGRKVLALLFAMVRVADSIDGCEALRAGKTRRLARRLDAGALDARDNPGVAKPGCQW